MRAFLFDLDGTLTHTMPLVLDALRAALAPSFGRWPDTEEVRRLLGPPEADILARAAPDDPEATERFYRYYREHHQRAAHVYRGVRPMLTALWDRGHPLALVTNKGRRSTAITLEELGLRRFFHVVVDGEDTGRPKPAPDGIALALERLRTPQVLRARAVYIGDMPSDLAAARAAGIAGWAAAWGRPDDAYAGWDFVALRPEDVLLHARREAAAET